MALRGRRGASSRSSSTRQWNYDVFLSFNGPDTRRNFTANLYEALERRGISTFIDDEQLTRRGETSLPSELIKAIEESRISVVILSKDYASSRWCLEELTKILECKVTKGQIILPVFYKVDPSEVRHQINSFKETFAKHEQWFKDNQDKVQRWKAALREVGSIAGWHLENNRNSEAEVIHQILNFIAKSHTSKHPVAIESWLRNGPDTHRNMTRLSYNALDPRGITTFVDDEYLRGGETFSPALIKAIEDSRISLIIFSQNYASSTWFLAKLMKILECKETKGQIVIPVLYKVDSSEVGHQRNSLGEAFAKLHEQKFKDDQKKVHRWKAALTQVANLSGLWHLANNRFKEDQEKVQGWMAQVALNLPGSWHFENNGNESLFIPDIANTIDLYSSLSPVRIMSPVQVLDLSSSSSSVGIESPVQFPYLSSSPSPVGIESPVQFPYLSSSPSPVGIESPVQVLNLSSSPSVNRITCTGLIVINPSAASALVVIFCCMGSSGFYSCMPRAVGQTSSLISLNVKNTHSACIRPHPNVFWGSAFVVHCKCNNHSP